MIGALAGDISGSRFEWDNIKSKEFELFTDECFLTDDSIMTIAVAEAILKSDGNWDELPEHAVKSMQTFGRAYPEGGYGGRFGFWIYEEEPEPYNSFGNGAAMRVSPCGIAGRTLEEAKLLSEKVTAVTHNHEEGLKGAEAVTAVIYLARHGKSKEEIDEYINENYYSLDFTLDDILDDFGFDVSCQGTVPQAIEAFLEAEDFEDAIRNAISIGGDSDTLAAIAGSMAEAYYGVPGDIREAVMSFLDEEEKKVVEAFEAKYER